jgi:hypothetical protein
MNPLADALRRAAANPTDSNIANVLTHVGDNLLKSERGRRSLEKRYAKAYPTHDPVDPKCKCAICYRIKSKPRHVHKAMDGSQRVGTAQCGRNRCHQRHIVCECRCGAVGVHCPKQGFTTWNA